MPISKVIFRSNIDPDETYQRDLLEGTVSAHIYSFLPRDLPDVTFVQINLLFMIIFPLVYNQMLIRRILEKSCYLGLD